MQPHRNRILFFFQVATHPKFLGSFGHFVVQPHQLIRGRCQQVQSGLTRGLLRGVRCNLERGRPSEHYRSRTNRAVGGGKWVKKGRFLAVLMPYVTAKKRTKKLIWYSLRYTCRQVPVAWHQLTLLVSPGKL